MENREKLRAKVARKLNDWDTDNHKNIQFILDIGDLGIEQIMSYVEVCDRIETMIETEQSGNISTFTFKKILDHEGILTSDSKTGRAAPTMSKFFGKIIVRLGSPYW